jgi:hypothetical protein
MKIALYDSEKKGARVKPMKPKSAKRLSMKIRPGILVLLSAAALHFQAYAQTGQSNQASPSGQSNQSAQAKARAPFNNGPFEKAFLALSNEMAANGKGHETVGFNPFLFSIPNKPFTATRTFIDQRQENGSDVGNPITASWTIARDDKGRVHYEMAFEREQDDRLVIGGFDIQIYDPVAQTITRYFADGDHAPPAKPIAEVRKLKLMSEISKPIPAAPPGESEKAEPSSALAAQEPSPAMAPDKSEPAKPAPVEFVPTKDSLPPQSIDGISVVIHRIILKYGDKHQFIHIDEDWLSPDWGIDMRRTTLRESIGIETVETKDIIPGLPDPSLFDIPPTYIVHVEK